MNNQRKSKRGGARKGAGRPRTQVIQEVLAHGGLSGEGPDLIRRIFARIHELNRPDVKTIEDYILRILFGATDVRVNKEITVQALKILFPQRTEITGKDGAPIPVIHTIRFGNGDSDK